MIRGFDTVFWTDFGLKSHFCTAVGEIRARAEQNHNYINGLHMKYSVR